MGKCSWNSFYFIFPCDVYLRFFLLVALVYLNPGFLYEKKKSQKNTNLSVFVYFFLFCNSHNMMFVLWAYPSGYPAFC